MRVSDPRATSRRRRQQPARQAVPAGDLAPVPALHPSPDPPAVDRADDQSHLWTAVDLRADGAFLHGYEEAPPPGREAPAGYDRSLEGAGRWIAAERPDALLRQAGTVGPVRDGEGGARRGSGCCRA